LSDSAAVRLAEVRAWWRLARPPKPLTTRLEAAYVLALAAGTVGLLLYGTASSALARRVTPDSVRTWGPSLLLVALLLAGRWGTWQGPVVFARADVAFLLGGPLPRSGLVGRRLGLALLRGALTGALVGAVAVVGLAGRGRSIAAGSAAGLLVGLALCGALAVGLAWAVQCSARASRWLGRSIPAAALLGAGMVAIARSGATGRAVILWSGPWGWAVQSVAGVSRPGWEAALALLALAAAGGCLLALRRAGACSTERHALRAEAREGAVASLGALDVRTAQLALRTVATKPRRLGRARVALPGSPPLAIPWRDLTAALRTPGRLAEAGLLAGGGTALALSDANHLAAAAVGALLCYFAVTRLLEPLRLEVDAPATARILLLRPFGRVLLSHVAVALAWVTLAALGALVPCALAHVIVARPAALATLVLLTLPTVALCAALSARRGGRMPLSVLFFASGGADPSGGGLVIAGWLLAWPAAAALLAGGAIHLASTAQGLTAALMLALLAPLVLANAVRGSQPG
jgi:hypothetical protein